MMVRESRFSSGKRQFVSRLVVASAIFVVVVVPTQAQRQNPLSIKARPLFQGLAATTSSLPLLVEVSNTGVDTEGEVTLSNGQSTTRYPITLPSGSKKRFIAYPDSSYEPPLLRLETRSGSAETRGVPSPNEGFGDRVAVMITDTPGFLYRIRRSIKPFAQTPPSWSASRYQQMVAR